MAYATLDYYKSTYGGASASDAIITARLNRASDDLDMLAVVAIDTDAMGSDQLDMLAKACCSQAEGYIQNGDADIAGNVSLGAFSMSGGSAKKISGIFARAYRFAILAGIGNRSVGALPHRNLQELNSGGVFPETT